MTEVPDWEDDTALTTPVNPTRCLWCKSSIEAAQTSTQLDTGERLCQSCLWDLREWKRTRFADILAAPSLEETIRIALLSDWRGLRDLLADIHHEEPGFKALPTRTSNAYERRIHDDSPTRSGDS